MHTIQSVARQTGLTPDVIRVWEKRYSAVSPERTPSNQRLYSETDITRLKLLKMAIGTGRRISAVAKLTDDELKEITQAASPAPVAPTAQSPVKAPTMHDGADPEFQRRAIEAVLTLDSVSLESLLLEALQKLGSVAFLAQAIFPLMAEIGSQWQSGHVRTCQEHFGSAHVRTFLSRHVIEANLGNQGPKLVLGTVPGCWHEIGVTMAALIAAQCGWQSVYLGANVPPEELAFAADMKEAKAVAVSISYPANPAKVSEQLYQLRKALGEEIAILTGGASLHLMTETLTSIKAMQCSSLQELQTQLNLLRYENS